MESPSMTEATPMMRSCATALNTMGGASNRPRDFQLRRLCAVSRNVIYFPRPKAYKQNADAMEAFKKTFPPAWRKSGRSLRPAHR